MNGLLVGLAKWRAKKGHCDSYFRIAEVPLVLIAYSLFVFWWSGGFVDKMII